LDSISEVDSGRLQKANTVPTIRKSVSWEDGGSPWQSVSDTFQTRLHGLYSQNTTTKKEMNFMKLAKGWNNSGSKIEGRDLIIQDEAIYALGKEEYLKTAVGLENGGGADFQNMLQEVFRQPDEQDKERNFMTLVKEWNRSVPALEVMKQTEASK